MLSMKEIEDIKEEWKDIRNAVLIGHNRMLKATDINIFVEDGQPYIHWTGEFKNGDDEYIVDIPKMDININAIVEEEPFELDASGYVSYPIVSFARHFYAVQENVKFSVTCQRREMTKEQIEKELGYKVKIKDEDDD